MGSAKQKKQHRAKPKSLASLRNIRNSVNSPEKHSLVETVKRFGWDKMSSSELASITMTQGEVALMYTPVPVCFDVNLEPFTIVPRQRMQSKTHHPKMCVCGKPRSHMLTQSRVDPLV